MQTLLRRLCIACIFFSIATPVFQMKILGWRSLEIELFWALFIVIGVGFGMLALLFSFLKTSSLVSRILQRVALLGSCAVVLFHGYLITTLSWHRYIAPSAEVILPPGFEGIFAIYVKELTKPSAVTAGKIYVYHVPENGALQVESGWVSAGINFKNVSPIPYSLLLRWSDGKPLGGAEAACKPLYEEWDEKGYRRLKEIGIACKVKRGNSRPVSLPELSYEEAYQFFSDHFKTKE